jgi:FKBP-type peptidyl-prolyl cis-trans isomerase
MRTTLLIVTLSLLLGGCPEVDEAATSTEEDVPAASGEATPDTDSRVTATVQKVADSESTDLPAPDDVAAAPADATRTASGLAYKVLQPGGGADHPAAADTVEVHYTGWMTDGKMFDSSVVRGQPAKFPLNMVIPGWTEGVQLMVVGEKTRFWIPAAMAYGETPRRPGAPAGDLVFDIELLTIQAAPKVPEDVAAAPKDATVTPSGLAYKVLTPGTNSQHPAATAKVTVHYSGWTADGKMFDSSVTRGEPATFPLNGVIDGWTEGVQLMVVGEKTRFWIPADLAYGETPRRPGAPSGMLVFDIELLAIE